MKRRTCNKKINLYTIEGKFVQTFDSEIAVAQYLELDKQTVWYILNNNGYRNNFQLKYYEGDTSDIPSKVKPKEVKYVKYYLLIDKEGNESEFNTLMEISKYLGVTHELVRLALKSEKWFCKKKFKVMRKVRLDER